MENKENKVKKSAEINDGTIDEIKKDETPKTKAGGVIVTANGWEIRGEQ